MPATFDHGYALLIAVSESALQSAALPDVVKDVEALSRVLADPERCGYRPENVKLLMAEAASRDGILAGLDWLREKLHSDPSDNVTALIYYTGHGHAEDGNYFLVPYDIKPGQLKLSLLRAQDFAEAVSDLKPKRLLILLDCCHAAGMEIKGLPALKSAAVPAPLFMAGAQGVSLTASDQSMETLAQGAGRAVLNSSQSNELSWIRKDHAMSIFTYHLIEALTGHAQPREGAREVLVSDVMSHVWRRVPASTRADWNAEQHPDYTVSGNFPVAQLLGGAGLAKGAQPPDPLEAVRPDRSAPGTQIGAIDARGSRGMIIGASGPIEQHFGNEIDTGGGAYVGGNFSVGAGGRFTGRDSIAQDMSNQQTGRIELVFAEIQQAAQAAPADKRARAVETAAALIREAAQAGQHDDSRMATLLERLAELSPGATPALLNAFATPMLFSITGPVTKFVLDKLRTQ